MNRSILTTMFLPLVFSAVFTACGSQSSGTQMVVHPADNTPITHIANSDSFGETAASPDGLYEVCQNRIGSYNLFYVDAATHQETYLCAAPNCTHDSESCSSYLPMEEGAYSYQIFFYKEHLYVVQNTPTADHGPYLMQMDPDGTNRKIVLELEDGEGFEGMVFGYGDRLLWPITKVDGDGQNQTFMETFNPQTGEREQLFSLMLKQGHKASASLMGAAGTSLIFLEGDSEGSQYYKVDLAKENPSLEQGKNNLLGPKFDGTSLYCTVQGEYFCTYDMHAGRLGWENLVTGRKKEFPLPQLAEGETAHGLALLYEDQFALSMDNAEKEPVDLLLDPETGAPTGVRYILTRENSYNILADFGDKLIYQMRTDEQPLEGQASQGLVGEVSYHNVYSIVSKESFRSGRPGEEIAFPG